MNCKYILTIFGLLFLYYIFTLTHVNCADRSFKIDYDNNQFLKDGKPFRYISGDFEYFKIPSAQWKDRLEKHKAAGLNAVQTYIAWNFHEPERGVYKFDGDLDFVEFFKLANEMGFVVVLRPGPFVNAEIDMGGLPYWLLSINKTMALRTSDAKYMAEVERWLAVLMPKIKPQLYQNGGPVIMVQVENEYAYWTTCDHKYIEKLRDLFRNYLGNDTILFNTDGVWHFDCSVTSGIFHTIDFGTKSDAKVDFDKLKAHQAKGPLVNSEFYPGWIDRWEQPKERVDTKVFAKALDVLLAMNASVNIYPLCGGTLFGFMSGSTHIKDNDFWPVVTSYEFDGPLTEAGDPTEKYWAVRDVIGKYVTLPSGELPKASPKMELPAITLKPVANIFDEKFTPNKSSDKPMTFEELSIREGFVLYSTVIDVMPSSNTLTINRLGDRAQVFVDKEYVGTLSLTHQKFSLQLNTLKKGSRLDVFVENQGRYAFLSVNQLKGITSDVKIGSTVVNKWNHTLFFKDWQKSIASLESSGPNSAVKALKSIPTIFTSKFKLPNDANLPHDSFLRLDGWGKGVAILNGFNLGRYWPLAGPQVTLYAPAHLFKPYPQDNVLTLFELEKNPCGDEVSCLAKFVKEHVLNGTVANDI